MECHLSNKHRKGDRMKQLFRCAFCSKVIPIKELCKADKYNERYCKQCTTFLEELIKQGGELHAD